MIKTVLFTSSLILLLTACGSNENVGQLKSLNQSLERANSLIKEGNRLVIEELREMQRDPQTSEGASLWLPKAEQITRKADSVRALIKVLKDKMILGSDSLRTNAAVVKTLSDVNGAGADLFKTLAAFKDRVPAIIFGTEVKNDLSSTTERINQLFKEIPLLPGYLNTLPAVEQAKYEKEWLHEGFGQSSSLMVMVMLNKVENDISATEKLLVDYCNDHIGRGCNAYNKFKAIGVLSSSYVKKGESIEIIAGVGGFSEASKPRITIGGKEIKLDAEGAAVYRFNANGKPGVHITTVGIEFYKPDGAREHITKTLKYTIAE
jgi:hypothetical protein